ncbi:hypothetical protein GCK32_006110 [Trichostrongylus colubriformis]|uniref:Uncharacterized protein n=1 Tax=Trichostrongylus colubriformis TaxID=6319 RepID=A0AAN8F9Z1_TRICO
MGSTKPDPVEELPPRRSIRTRKLTERVKSYVKNGDRPWKLKDGVNRIDVLSRVNDKEEAEGIRSGHAVRLAMMWTYTPMTTPAVPSPPPPPPLSTYSPPASSGPIVIQLAAPAVPVQSA